MQYKYKVTESDVKLLFIQKDSDRGNTFPGIDDLQPGRIYYVVGVESYEANTGHNPDIIMSYIACYADPELAHKTKSDIIEKFGILNVKNSTDFKTQQAFKDYLYSLSYVKIMLDDWSEEMISSKPFFDYNSVYISDVNVYPAVLY